MLTGSQGATETDHLRDAAQTAELIEEADRYQQPQGSSGSGFDDGPDPHDLCSTEDDQFLESHQTLPSSAVLEGRPNGHQWHSALLSDPTPPTGQAHQLPKAASQQLHHERIAEAQHAHEWHKSFPHGLRGRSTIQDDGYQSMHGQRSFDPRSVQQHFRGIGHGGNILEDPSMQADPADLHVAVSLLHLCHRTCVTPSMPSMRPAVSVHQESVQSLYQVRVHSCKIAQASSLCVTAQDGVWNV